MIRYNLLLIAVPAYNEAKVIGKVLKEIPKKIENVKLTKVVVIDDGSKDNTASIAKKNKALVLKHLINRGLGASIKSAFVYAREIDSDILVTLDADGQHDPKDLKRIISPIIQGKADVVIGSRLIRDHVQMPFLRKITNLLANMVTYLLTGIYTTDSQSGYRAFSKKAINKIELITQRMEVSSEIFREIKRNNLEYEEISIKPIYTDYSLSKGQSMLNAPNVFLKLLIRAARR